MTTTTLPSEIITNWEPHHADLFSKHNLRLNHAMADHPLFTDDALARLIEKSKRDAYHVNTMDNRSHNPRSRREGELGGLSGHETLEAVRKGNIWINIQRPGEVDSGYNDLLEALYAEFEERVPGFKSYKHKMTLLISSPNVTVYYHCDIPGQTLWQVRGEKRVYVYPATGAFLTQQAMEKIVLNMAHETDMPYAAWFDEYAQIFDLKPGEMLHWPLNCPHRVVNANVLNVSFTTEHWADDLRATYAVNYANGILRQKLGMQNLGRATSGLGYYSKLALAGAVKFSGLQKKREMKFKIDFAVDPAAHGSVRDIPAYALQK